MDLKCHCSIKRVKKNCKFPFDCEGKIYKLLCIYKMILLLFKVAALPWKSITSFCFTAVHSNLIMLLLTIMSLTEQIIHENVKCYIITSWFFIFFFSLFFCSINYYFVVPFSRVAVARAMNITQKKIIFCWNIVKLLLHYTLHPHINMFCLYWSYTVVCSAKINIKILNNPYDKNYTLNI